MFSALRSSFARTSALRSFSTSSTRRYDLAKLMLIGSLVKDPEPRFTRNEKEYVLYTVVTNNYPPPPPDANGDRHKPATFHRILSFNESSHKYLKTLKKGSRVYVEASYELREPEPGTDPLTPQGQRQIFLRHESIRLLSSPRPSPNENENEGGN